MGGRWKSQNRKNVYLSPYFEEPLNSKVIKSFVPDPRSRKCFSCFEIPMFYFMYIWMFYIHFTHIRIWLCSINLDLPAYLHRSNLGSNISVTNICAFLINALWYWQWITDIYMREWNNFVLYIIPFFLIILTAQSVEAVEYTDCISAEL